MISYLSDNILFFFGHKDDNKQLFLFTIGFVVWQVLRAGEGLQTVEDAELSKLVQDEQYVLALFCKSASGLPCTSVAPYVFGPPGSGSVSQMYGSGSRSFYYQVKT
jgi:hypothetical protein